MEAYDLANLPRAQLSEDLCQSRSPQSEAKNETTDDEATDEDIYA
jgi:hypothetical protein